MTYQPLLEACVESTNEAMHAWKNGAHQLEICSQLEYDGLTPEVDVVDDIITHVKIPCKVMIRNRKGDFYYTNEEIQNMVLQLHHLKTSGTSGFVFGAIKRDEKNRNILDLEAISQICIAASPLPVTIHKAIDLCDDLLTEVKALRNISNVHFILTSGGAPDAELGSDMLVKMQKTAGKKITIIAAGKITKENIDRLITKTGIKIYHGRRIV